MPSIGSNKRRKGKGKDFIFRNRSSKSKSRQIIEAVILLVVGVNLVIFLNTLPSEFVIARLSLDTWNQISTSFISLITSLTGIGVALIVILLLLFSLIFIFAGLWRLFIIFNKNKPTNIRRNDNSTN